MIKKFSVENFYSICNTTDVDFTVNKKAPDTSGYIGVKNSPTRVTKLALFIGSNASGKTNVFKAISFLKWLVVASLERKPDEEISFSPFLFCAESLESPTKLCVGFFIGDEEYEYALMLTKKRVLSERLSKRITKKMGILFVRAFDQKTGKYVFTQRNGFRLPVRIKNLVRDNTLLVAVAAQFNHTESARIVGYFKSITTNISKSGHISMDNFEKDRVLNQYQQEPDMKEQAEAILRSFDLGLQKVDINIEKRKNERGEDEKYWRVSGVHRGDGKKDYSLSFDHESQGTKDLFVALALLLPVLRDGGVAVLDELQNAIHPHVMSAILGLFFSKRHNPKNAQLIWSAHGVPVMNELDKQQIYLVEKNDLGCTDVWRLDEVEGVGNRDNFFAKYLSGAYSAVPRLSKT